MKKFFLFFIIAMISAVGLYPMKQTTPRRRHLKVPSARTIMKRIKAGKYESAKRRISKLVKLFSTQPSTASPTMQCKKARAQLRKLRDSCSRQMVLDSTTNPLERIPTSIIVKENIPLTQENQHKANLCAEGALPPYAKFFDLFEAIFQNEPSENTIASLCLCIVYISRERFCGIRYSCQAIQNLKKLTPDDLATLQPFVIEAIQKERNDLNNKFRAYRFFDTFYHAYCDSRTPTIAERTQYAEVHFTYHELQTERERRRRNLR